MQIEKRRRRYFAIRVLPRDVRGFFNKTRLSQSLKTEDLQVAKLRAAVLDAQWSRQIAEAREALGKGAPGDAREFWTQQLANAGSDFERDMLRAIIAGEAQRASPAYWRGELAAAPPEARSDLLDMIADEAQTRAQLASPGFAEIDPDADREARRWYRSAIGADVPLLDQVPAFVEHLRQQGAARKTIMAREGAVRAGIDAGLSTTAALT